MRKWRILSTVGEESFARSRCADDDEVLAASPWPARGNESDRPPSASPL
jgi:hypothetical protein